MLTMPVVGHQLASAMSECLTECSLKNCSHQICCPETAPTAVPHKSFMTMLDTKAEPKAGAASALYNTSCLLRLRS